MSASESQIEGQSPVRLNGRATPVGTATGLPAWGMVLFGLPFVGVGIWGSLAGLEIIPVDPSNVHAPMWVLAVFGIVFFCAGVMLWGMGWRQVSHLRKVRQHAQLHPNLPAMTDYYWEESGYSPSRWQPVLKGLSGALFMTVFLSIFNWWAFGSGDHSWFLKIIVSVFDLLLIYIWFVTFKSIVHALKFGKTRLEFSQFPYYLGDYFQANIQLPAGLERVESAKMVLRCVREFYETQGYGKNRNKKLVHEQLWAEEQAWTGAEIGQWPSYLKGTFAIPNTAPSSRITAQADEKPIFWELEMQLAVPGVDLKQSYLVPVYAQDSESVA